MAHDDNGGVKSARRALELLETISTYKNGVSFAELSTRLGFPKSSLHGLLHTLADMRWITLDSASRLYSIGVRPWEVGQSFLHSRELVVRARQHLRIANEELSETIQLGILDDLDVVYIDKVEGTNPLRLVSDIGSRLPAYVTGIGKAMLAGLSDAVLQDRFAGSALDSFTAQTITSGDDLLRVLDTVRTRGFAEDDGEYTTGVYCVAVPIRNGRGETVAAMSCSVPRSRIDSGELSTQGILDVLQRQASLISDSLVTPLPA